MMDNEVLKALHERRSVRKYKPEQITDEELLTVLEAGTYAPTHRDAALLTADAISVGCRILTRHASG